MALVPEDGTIVVDANTYVEMAYANAYHAARNNTDWDTAEDEAKEAALIYATKWIDEAPLRWVGSKTSTLAGTLNWPRIDAYDDNGVRYTGVPSKLQDAVCELALAHLSKALNEVLSRGGEISSVWVGPITVSWNDWASADRSYPMVKRLLKGLYSGGGGMFRRIVRG